MPSRPRLLARLSSALSVVWFAVLAAAGVTHAAPPATLNYQGNLTNASAQPVNNGALTMTFRLYDAATAGNLLYSETQTVSVTNGLFNVRIGAVTPIALPFDAPYFLGVTVGGDAEMSPRQPLSSSAYAFRASSADTLAPTATVAGSQITGSITTATIPAANVIGGVGGSGTVTSVATGAGLSGGPITSSGTINLASTNLLPTTACATDEIAKWSGSAWVCSTAGAGTVTSISTINGLTANGLPGGTITGSGAIGLAPTQRLPATACATNQIPRWNGSDWVCATNASLPAGGAIGETLAGSAGGPIWSTSLAPSGNLDLAASTSTSGNILKAGNRLLHTAGNNNLFLGLNSGNFSLTGARNVASGNNALAGLTTGNDNLAIGDSALRSTTTGTTNIAVGNGALRENVAGIQNVAVGINALYFSTGSNNTAVGAQGMYNMTGGQNNTSLGAFALSVSTFGSSNTAIGSDALRFSTNNNNTAIGQSALTAVTTGDNNTAIGQSAMSAMTTGQNNIAVGRRAGFLVTTGSSNIMVGNFGDAADTQTIRIGDFQSRAFVAGIRGASPAGSSLLPVVIDENGQLGTSAGAGSGSVTSVATGAGLTGGPISTTGTINLAATNLLPVTACATNQIPKWNGSAWACASDDSGSAGVTNVATGAGLTGGPITTSGTINLAATNLLPTTACATNQVPKWSGTAWACAADADTNSGGTVTSVATGSGLTGGTITASGTIGLAATNLLPTTACTTNQIAKWNGTAWACAADAGLPAGGTTGQVLAGNAGGAIWSNSLQLAANLELPDSTASAGNILKAGSLFMHNRGNGANTYLGTLAGNSVTSAIGNTGVGTYALRLATSGGSNTAVGSFAMEGNLTGEANVALGNNALAFHTSGNENTALGRFAMRSVTSGQRNTAVGSDSLGNVSGDDNIALGQRAAYNLTAGSGNIAIGNEGVASESNTLRLGSAQTRAFVAGIRGVTPPGASPLPVVIDANGQLGTGAADGGGTVTSVNAGAGLTGGTITSTGTISLAATNLLPTTACAANQIAKWSGSAWACAADADTDSGGTVTNVATGPGLTGGAITSTGTIGLAATNLLPTTACAANQIPKWSGSAWGCAADASVPAGGIAGQLLAGSGSGPTWASSVTLSGNLDVAGAIDTNGFLTRNGNRMLSLTPGPTGYVNLGDQAGGPSPATNGNYQVAIGHYALSNVVYGMYGDGWANTAVGDSASRFNSTGRNNTALGSNALRDNTTGGSNVAVGSGALIDNTGGNNIAIGAFSGQNLTTGNHNIAVANDGVAGESNTVRIGTAANQTRVFVAGIAGVSPPGGTVLPVVIDANGQLGTGTAGGSLPSGGAAGEVLVGSAGGPTWSTTIAPNGNINLANSTASVGNILKAGSRFIHSFGTANVFAGLNAGNVTLTGSENAAFGANALTAATSGSLNTAIGRDALLANTSGGTNTAIGARALQVNVGGSENTALGIAALDSNTSGTRNIGIGLNGGASLTTGNHNIAIANEGVAGESGTIRLGDSVNQTRAFIAGIRGITTGSATGINVLIDANGQLGTVSSSAALKNDIADMADASDVLSRLRPVSFRYKSHDGGPLQFGLIAEEVAEVAPELVARNARGEIETVFYQHLPPMLLNEFQKQQRTIQAQAAQLAAVANENRQLRGELDRIKAHLGLR